MKLSKKRKDRIFDKFTKKLDRIMDDEKDCSIVAMRDESKDKRERVYVNGSKDGLANILINLAQLDNEVKDVIIKVAEYLKDQDVELPKNETDES